MLTFVADIHTPDKQTSLEKSSKQVRRAIPSYARMKAAMLKALEDLRIAKAELEALKITYEKTKERCR